LGSKPEEASVLLKEVRSQLQYRRTLDTTCFAGATGEVPTIARDVHEHRDLAVRLPARWPHELDSGCDHSLVMSSEVVHAKEESHTSGVLISNDCGLALTVCTGQEQARLGAWRTYNNPALRATVGGHCRRVLDELELQDVDEKPYGRVILMDHNRYELKIAHRRSLKITWVEPESQTVTMSP
jgi:hypothetical protein